MLFQTISQKAHKMYRPEPRPSLSCLPDEMVVECLLRVPRRYYENLSCVSSKLRSLVRSPELLRMRSLLHKDSVYICFSDMDNYSKDATYQWFTLRQTKTEEGYQLVPVPFPSRSFMLYSASVAVDSEIYFIGGVPKQSELWILDTKSGKLRQGPILRAAPHYESKNVVGVADEKIYVVQQLENGGINEEVFDLESGNWQVEGVPVPEEYIDQRPMMKSSVTLQGKLYGIINNVTLSSVYNLRQGRRMEKLETPIGETWVWSICAADHLLFACFCENGLMWLDTKCSVWRVVGGDVQTLSPKLHGTAMVEYYGKLAIFWRERANGTSKNKNKVEKIWCAMIALDKAGGGVRGTIEWSGVVATIPYRSYFLHCLVASD